MSDLHLYIKCCRKFVDTGLMTPEDYFIKQLGWKYVPPEYYQYEQPKCSSEQEPK